MKRIIAILILAAAPALADTAYMHTPSQKVRWSRPTLATLPDGSVCFDPTDATLQAAGYAIVEYAGCEPMNRVVEWTPAPSVRCMTAEEIAARDAADAAALIAAQEAATLPHTFPTGIAVPSADHWFELVPDGTNGVVEAIAIQISASPLDPTTRNAMKADLLADRAAKKNTAKNAKASGSLVERIAALEALLGVE